MKQGLIIIDVQNDYFASGNMTLVNTKIALQNTLALQTFFRSQNKPIFYIQHVNVRQGATFFKPNTPGINIHSRLLPIKVENNEVIIRKHYPNSFKDTTLQTELSRANIEQVVICGMMSHMCVDSTTRQAAELGYQPILIADACATRDLTFQSITIKAEQVQIAFMSALANFSDVYNTQQFMAIND